MRPKKRKPAAKKAPPKRPAPSEESIDKELRAKYAQRRSGKPVWALYRHGLYETGTFWTKKEALRERQRRIRIDLMRATDFEGAPDEPQLFLYWLQHVYQIDRVMVLAVPGGV